MKILLTNDDGYFSKGITELDAMLSELGDVTVVAPENNHSGASSSLTLKNPLRIRKYKDNGFYVNGTPADCVFMAMTRILKSPPDILVSGINHGANLGDDVLYSGTVGAAMGLYSSHLLIRLIEHQSIVFVVQVWRKGSQYLKALEIN